MTPVQELANTYARYARSMLFLVIKRRDENCEDVAAIFVPSAFHSHYEPHSDLPNRDILWQHASNNLFQHLSKNFPPLNTAIILFRKNVFNSQVFPAMPLVPRERSGIDERIRPRNPSFLYVIVEGRSDHSNSAIDPNNFCFLPFHYSLCKILCRDQIHPSEDRLLKARFLSAIWMEVTFESESSARDGTMST